MFFLLPFSFTTIHSFIHSMKPRFQNREKLWAIFLFSEPSLIQCKAEWMDRETADSITHQPKKILYLSFSLQFWENFPKMFVILHDTMVVNWNSWVQLNFFSFIQFNSMVVVFVFFLIFSNWFYPAGWGQRKDFLTLMFLNGFFFFFYHHHHHHWCFWFDSFFFCFVFTIPIFIYLIYLFVSLLDWMEQKKI